MTQAAQLIEKGFVAGNARRPLSMALRAMKADVQTKSTNATDAMPLFLKACDTATIV